MKDDYLLSDLLEMAPKIRLQSLRISTKAGDIPFTDVDSNKLVETALRYIDRVDWFIGDMGIYSRRINMNEKAIRYLAKKSYLSDCEKAYASYMQAAKALEK